MNAPPEFVARELPSYMFVVRVLLSYLITFRRWFSKTSPHFHLSCQRERDPLSVHMRKWPSDFLSSLVIFNYHEWLCLVIRCQLSALFIYLFIYSFNFLWAVQLSYIRLCSKREKMIYYTINKISKLARKNIRLDTTGWAWWFTGNCSKNWNLTIQINGICTTQNLSRRNETHKHLWGFDIQTVHLILVRRANLLIFNSMWQMYQL